MGFETALSKGLLEDSDLETDIGTAADTDLVGSACFAIAAFLARIKAGSPSPSLARVSMHRSKSSFRPLRTISFRRLFVNPNWCNTAIFASRDAVVTSATGAPSPVVLAGGGGDQGCWSEVDAFLVPNRRRLEVDEEDRRPKPKNLPDFGGNGGGDSVGDPGDPGADL